MGALSGCRVVGAVNGCRVVGAVSGCRVVGAVSGCRVVDAVSGCRVVGAVSGCRVVVDCVAWTCPGWLFPHCDAICILVYTICSAMHTDLLSV